MLSVMGGTINVFFDAIIVGKLLGNNALTAVNLSLPLYLTICSVGTLIGVGASICASHEIGHNRAHEARRIYNSSVILALISGLIVMLAGLVLIRPLASLLNGRNGVQDLVSAYVSIIVCGAIPKILSGIPLNFLRLDGKNVNCSVVMLTLTALNIVFDLLFMGPLKMGIAGSALADVIATTVATAFGFFFLQQKKSGFRLRRDFVPVKQLLAVVKSGSPAWLGNILSSARVFALNTIIAIAGGPAYILCLTVANYLNEFLLCISMGVPMTAGPLIGVYAGERDNSAIRKLMYHQLKIGIMLGTVFALVISLFANAIAWIFGVTENVQATLIGFGLSLVFMQINYIMINFYNTTDRILIANLATGGRLFFFAAGIAWLLSSSGKFIWLFYPLSEIATIALWLILARVEAKKDKRLSGILLLDDTLEKSGNVLDFSIAAKESEICNASSRIGEYCKNNNLSEKQTFVISLAVEEITGLMASHCFGKETGAPIDVRAFHTEEETGIRVRCGGEQFNPVAYAESEGDAHGDAMGIHMLMKMAKEIYFQNTFGTNSVLIHIHDEAPLNTDFMCESRLKELDPELHSLYSNCVLVSQNILNSFSSIFPDFTDHTILHSIEVIDFCNLLIGNQIKRMTADDLYVLLMGALMHDWGMGISKKDYMLLCPEMDIGDIDWRNPSNMPAVVRSYHNEISGKLIEKYSEFFDIPNKNYTFALIQVCRGHRKTDLFDPDSFPEAYEVGEGRIIHLPYIAALLRMADELDIAVDRNLDFIYDMSTIHDPQSIFEFARHKAIKEVRVEKNSINIFAETDQHDIYDGINELAVKLQETLNYCCGVINNRTRFRLSQNRIKLDLKWTKPEDMH